MEHKTCFQLNSLRTVVKYPLQLNVSVYRVEKKVVANELVFAKLAGAE